MSDYIMTPAEVREYERLRKLAAEVRVRAGGSMSGHGAGAGHRGACLRVAGFSRDVCQSTAELDGWAAADALIGPAMTPPDMSPVDWCEVGRSHLIGHDPCAEISITDVGGEMAFRECTADEAERIARALRDQVEAIRAEAADEPHTAEDDRA